MDERPLTCSQSKTRDTLGRSKLFSFLFCESGATNNISPESGDVVWFTAFALDHESCRARQVAEAILSRQTSGLERLRLLGRQGAWRSIIERARVVRLSLCNHACRSVSWAVYARFLSPATQTTPRQCRPASCAAPLHQQSSDPAFGGAPLRSSALRRSPLLCARCSAAPFPIPIQPALLSPSAEPSIRTTPSPRVRAGARIRRVPHPRPLQDAHVFARKRSAQSARWVFLSLSLLLMISQGKAPAERARSRDTACVCRRGLRSDPSRSTVLPLRLSAARRCPRRSFEHSGRAERRSLRSLLASGAVPPPSPRVAAAHLQRNVLLCC